MTTMKAGLYLAPKQVAVEQLAKPKLQPGEALIKVAYAGICGTDMMIYAGKHPRAQAPLAMGHEFCGVIHDLHNDSHSPFSPGDRVVIEPTLSCGTCDACLAGQMHVCRKLKLIGIDRHGGFAEFAAVPVHRLHRIPDELPDDQAALAEPVAVAVHTVRRSRLKVGDQVAILGAGPIGLLIGLIAKQAGAGQILITDISPYRLGKAAQLGLTALDARSCSITEEIARRTDGLGADIVFEAAGTQTTAQQMLEAVRTQGQVVVVSVFKQPPTVDLAAMHYREISMTSTRCYSSGDFQKALQLMKLGTIDVRELISHKLPLDQLAAGFHHMHQPDASMKVLFQP